MPEIHREYRDRLFCYIFGSEAHKEWTLSLYNAVNGTAYTDPGLISITTIEQVLYMGMHNDVAFLISDEINLYEQQSTPNPNIPLRLLQYTANIYERLISLWKKNKFGTTLIQLPVPKLVVFYNGLADQPEERTLNLSDAFAEDVRDESDISVRVRMININKGHSAGVVNSCKPLNEYTWLVDRIRTYGSRMPLETAVDLTLREMPEDYQIKPWLEANREGVKRMLLTEYDEAKTMELFREEGREEGRAEGREQGFTLGIARLAQLMAKLFSQGRSADAERAANDEDFRNRLFEEYGID